MSQLPPMPYATRNIVGLKSKFLIIFYLGFNHNLLVIISVLLILEKTHAREIQEALFSLMKIEGLK